MIKIRSMTRGQLILEYASTCQYHGGDGAQALAYASVVPTEYLRGALLDYTRSMRLPNLKKAERALIRVVEKARGQK